jgi:galactose mutarotase-like enzyme
MQIEIVALDQVAAVDRLGGGLRSYIAAGRELLDGYPAGERPTSGRGQVLIPWPNRLEDGTYEFDGRSHQLPVNEPDKGDAIHGLVREEVWTVFEQAADRVLVGHELTPRPGYPFALTLRIEYALSEHGLTVRTSATNVGNDACPYGSGQHPYLTLGTPVVDSLILAAPGRTVLRHDERGLPVASEAVEGTDYDFHRPREIGTLTLDHGFTDLVRGADGLARVELRDPRSRAGLTLWVDESYRHVQLFTGDPLSDVGRRSIAVEPMTCPANAFRTGEDLVRLEPGETHTASWGIVPA